MQISIFSCHFTMWHGTFSVINSSVHGLVSLRYPCHSIMATIGKSTSFPIRQPSDKPCPGLILAFPFLSPCRSEFRAEFKMQIQNQSYLSLRPSSFANRFVRCSGDFLADLHKFPDCARAQSIGAPESVT